MNCTEGMGGGRDREAMRAMGLVAEKLQHSETSLLPYLAHESFCRDACARVDHELHFTDFLVNVGHKLMEERAGAVIAAQLGSVIAAGRRISRGSQRTWTIKSTSLCL